MERREKKSMLATLLLAVAIPVALSGVASRTLGRPADDPEKQMKPYRELLANVDRTIASLDGKAWAGSEAIDWGTIVPPRPAPSGSDPASGDPDELEPPPVPPAPLFNLYLGGIIWKRGQPHAYVNERVVTQGEVVDGFRVVSIARNRVTFADSDGQIYTCDIDEQLRNTYPEYDQP